MSLPKEWREFIESLNSNKVEYLVVGAVALAHHGRPRYTGDLDILIRSTRENVSRLKVALGAFGMGSMDLTVKDLTTPDQVIQLGVPPNRIDLLTSISGVTFEQAWEDRVGGTIEGTPATFIGRQSLIQNKRATGRPQDLADLQAIKEAD
jgi:hypothetical protein